MEIKEELSTPSKSCLEDFSDLGSVGDGPFN